MPLDRLVEIMRRLRDPVSGNVFLAGDADGDGIADSGLFLLPVGQINGVTYYASVRIVDNAAAINVNTAWSHHVDYDFSGNPILSAGFFRREAPTSS